MFVGFLKSSHFLYHTVSLLPHRSPWYDKEQFYVYFYVGGSSVTALGNTLIYGIAFRNLIILVECISGHIEDIKILGEELKRMYSESL